MTTAEHARSVIDFVLDLSQNPDKAAEYKADPAGYLTRAGFDADLRQQILQAQESALARHTTRFDEDGGEVASGGGDQGGGTTVIVAVVVVVVA